MKKTIKNIIIISQILKEINFFPIVSFIILLCQMVYDYCTVGTITGKCMVIPVIFLIYIVIKQYLFNLFDIEDETEE